MTVPSVLVGGLLLALVLVGVGKASRAGWSKVHGSAWASRMRGRWPLFWITVAAALGVGVVGLLVARGDVVESADLPSLVVGLLAVAVALLTLKYVAPRPARVLVMRQDELGFSDLIFYMYQSGDQQVPRDYLLQLHVAVANVGGRKAVVSKVEIDTFHGSDRSPRQLPDAPTAIRASQFYQQHGWRNHKYFTENVSRSGPWLLEPGDVITLRFRARRGIDWSARWTLASLRSFGESVEQEFVAASGCVTWREGRHTNLDRFEVAVESVQQHEYVNALREITQEFTIRPSVDEQRIEIE